MVTATPIPQCLSSVSSSRSLKADNGWDKFAPCWLATSYPDYLPSCNSLLSPLSFHCMQLTYCLLLAIPHTHTRTHSGCSDDSGFIVLPHIWITGELLCSCMRALCSKSLSKLNKSWCPFIPWTLSVSVKRHGGHKGTGGTAEGKSSVIGRFYLNLLCLFGDDEGIPGVISLKLSPATCLSPCWRWFPIVNQ